MGLKRNDEVITVCNSFYASAGAIVACGAKPVFIDSDERYQIDVNKIEKSITNMQAYPTENINKIQH